MVKLEPVPDKRFGTVWQWMFPEVCPNGHRGDQRVSWEGCSAGQGHHAFVCSECLIRYVDPDCACQGGGDPECE